jgi:hypothetical protein
MEPALPDSGIAVETGINMGSPPPPGGLESAFNNQSVLIFGQKPEELRSARRRSRAPVPGQGQLFNWS